MWKRVRSPIGLGKSVCSSGSPPKVLHIVESLDRGAVENWLLRMLRHGRRSGVPMNWGFLCALSKVGEKEADALQLGAEVIPASVPVGDTLRFLLDLRRIVREGKYDVVHCHHDLISGLYLLAMIGLSVRTKIVHVHNAEDNLPTPSRWKRALLRQLLRTLCLVLADRVVGISKHTLATFTKSPYPKPVRDTILFYGVDAAPFVGTGVDRVQFRAQLGLGANAIIILFAGRLVPEKNPVFVLEVVRELRRMDSRVVAVFVGSGSEEHALKTTSKLYGMESAVRFMGWRNDIAAIMSGCDLFMLPRPEDPMEGFGLAVVEAQLAGLRVLVSYGISEGPFLSGSAIRRVRLAEAASVWANAANDLLKAPRPSRDRAIRALAQSPMALDRALSGLLALHNA